MLKTGSVRSLLLLIIFIAFNSSSASQDLTNKLNEIESYAAKVGEDWKVPGFAIAVVKNDKIVFAKGFGIKQLGKAELVDKETIFAIASNTKAFTAAALATLVDERKIRWDDPVTKYISWFQLYDPWVTRELTVRDLLSPRSGLATFGGDLLWFESNYSREEIIRRIRFLKPAHSFRSRFGYQNIMFITAGELIPAVTGKSWDDYLRERFFVPLRMERTTTTYKQLLVTPNLALPHNEVEGKLRVVRYDNVDNAAAAGSINSSVADMAQWVRLQLNRGSLDGKKIFSAERSREMWTPNTIASGISEAAEKFSPTTHFNLYGLGWGLSDYHGRKVIAHGGGLVGMISRVALMPEQNLGLVILSNSESPLVSILSYKIFDVFLDVPKRDWNSDFLARSRQAEEQEKAIQKKIEDSRLPNTKPSLPLAAYAGTYRGDIHGDASVTEENGKLVLRLQFSPNFVADLSHWHLDSFSLKWRESVIYPFGRGFVSFIVNSGGKVTEAKIDLPNRDFDFSEIELKRIP